MKKIGIIADTHNLLREEVLQHLRQCECILHAGDICTKETLARLGTIAPVKAVRGNNDREWGENEDLPDILDFGLEGIHICMCHRKKDLPKDLSPFDLVIYGHSHQYASIWQDYSGLRRTLLLNPGSCGPRRFTLPITLAILQIEGDGWNIRRIQVSQKDTNNKQKSETSASAQQKTSNADIHKQIEIIIKETEKGLSYDSIAKKHGLDPGTTEQIVRLYVTHPGVTADGIMEKMGLLGKL